MVRQTMSMINNLIRFVNTDFIQQDYKIIYYFQRCIYRRANRKMTPYKFG
jgi:hypothetical protein